MIDWLPGYAVLQSPNRSTRGGFGIEGVVIHFTGSPANRGAARWLAHPEAKASAHFVGFRNGTGVQQVPLGQKAWHAGAAEWIYRGKPERDPNRYTVGIELCNCGPVYRAHDGSYWYQIGRSMRQYSGPDPVEAALVFPGGYTVEGYWEPYPSAQIDWLENLLDALAVAGVPISLVGHEEIATPEGRKIDPGPLFPWARLGRLHGVIKTSARWPAC